VSVLDAFDARRNGFTPLRLLLSVSVLVYHCYALGKLGLDPWARLTMNETLGGMAVCSFFVVSGFLTTMSFCSCQSTGRFLWHRALRILPAFWVCLLVTVFVFGPILARLQGMSLSRFLTDPHGPLAYLTANGLLWHQQLDISGLPKDVPIPYAVNGSLWTLFYEAICYLALAALGWAGIVRWHRAGVLFLFLGLYALHVVQLSLPGAATRLFPLLDDQQLPRMATYYLAGAVVYLYRDRIPYSPRVAVLVLGALALGTYYGAYVQLAPVATAYLLIYGAIAIDGSWLHRRADLSYGGYLYAFPVQQVLAVLGLHQFGVVIYSLVSLLGAGLLAVASWRLVEAPALRWKGWTPTLPTLALPRRAPRPVVGVGAVRASGVAASGFGESTGVPEQARQA